MLRMPDEDPCPDRHRLAQQLVKAIQATKEAKADFDRAVIDPKSIQPYAEALHCARVAEYQAVVSLEGHRKEHGC